MALLLSNEERIRRLKIASDRVGGDANLGRLMKYRDGAFVGQMLRGEKTITEKTIKKLVAVREISDLFSWHVDTAFKIAEDESAPTTDLAQPVPISSKAERRLTRFLAVLYQLPDAERESALIEATEVLLDHLPVPPTERPAFPGQK